MYYSIVAYTMNIIIPCRHQLCAWFVIMVYIMCYLYCELHYEYVRVVMNIIIMCYVYHDHFDEYLEQLL